MSEIKIGKVHGKPSIQTQFVLFQADPGSGKTTLAHAIEYSDPVYKQMFGVDYWNDYSWLYYHFLREKKQEQMMKELTLQKPYVNVASYQHSSTFRANPGGGFDILDQSILDTALEVIAHKVSNSLQTAPLVNISGKLVSSPPTLKIGDVARPFNSFAQKAMQFLGNLKEVLTVIVIDVPPELTISNIMARQNKASKGEESHNPGSPSILKAVYHDNRIPGSLLCHQLASSGFSCILIEKTGLVELTDYIAVGQEIADILFN